MTIYPMFVEHSPESQDDDNVFGICSISQGHTIMTIYVVFVA